jgi:ribosomal protein S18 acetylase RimI-like enzyme
MDLHLHRCTGKDVERLARISRQTFADAFEAQNDPQDFEHYLSTAFHPGQLLSEINNPHSIFHFAYSGEALVGYFKVNMAQAQTELKDEEGMELERIYVMQALQGMKIGEWMVDQVTELARQMQKKYVWLGVWEHNAGAIRFYLKLGFIQFGTHPYYIGKDRQTDWLLRLDLGNLNG